MGTSRLHREIFREVMTPEIIQRRRSRAYTPESIAQRAAKMAVIMKGRPVFDRTGLKATAEQRQAQRERMRGTVPAMIERPWTKAEVRLLATQSPAEVAQRTGRTIAAVYIKRRKLRMNSSK